MGNKNLQALSNLRHEWERKMVPKINLGKDRMRSETSRKRTKGSIHSNKKEATKRKKKDRKYEKTVSKNYTTNPVTPIFTLDSDDKNDKGGENGKLCK